MPYFCKINYDLKTSNLSTKTCHLHFFQLFLNSQMSNAKNATAECLNRPLVLKQITSNSVSMHQRPSVEWAKSKNKVKEWNFPVIPVPKLEKWEVKPHPIVTSLYPFPMFCISFMQLLLVFNVSLDCLGSSDPFGFGFKILKWKHAVIQSCHRPGNGQGKRQSCKVTLIFFESEKIDAFKEK